MKATCEFLGHLGLVAGVFDELGIAEVVDRCLPKSRVHRVGNGVVLKALTLNGLGFVERRLYMFSEYLQDMAVDRLLGDGVSAGDFSDDVLGRFLDSVYAYGSTRLFNEIVLEIMKNRCFGSRLLHVDTTSFSVSGEYQSEGARMFELNIGRPKDGRWDLNRFVLSLVSDQHGVPLYMKALSGNSSDKKSLVEAVEYVRSNLCFDAPVYYVADSAFYTDENLGRVGAHTFWVSRVPGTITEAQSLLEANVDLALCSDPRYQYYEATSCYAGIPQKWVLYRSSEMQARMEKTFDKNLLKEVDEAGASLKHACNVEYYCREDAVKGAEEWLQGHPRLKYENIEVITVSRRKNGRKGRPRKDEELGAMFKIKATVRMKEDVVKEEREKLGRFILATNDTGLSADKLLEYYKGQGTVERGFRFLKDRSFRVSEVFLKKPERIEALAMVMVLSLFVYSYAERKLREQLAKNEETVLSQLKKPTNRPTLKWVFYKYDNVTVVKLEDKGHCHTEVANMKDEHWKILRLLGPAYEKYYL